MYIHIIYIFVYIYTCIRIYTCMQSLLETKERVRSCEGRGSVREFRESRREPEALSHTHVCIYTYLYIYMYIYNTHPGPGWKWAFPRGSVLAISRHHQISFANLAALLMPRQVFLLAEAACKQPGGLGLTIKAERLSFAALHGVAVVVFRTLSSARAALFS